MSTLLIGFGNKARRGKDTAVAAVIERYRGEYDVRRYAFGDDLKAEFYDLLLNPLNEYWGSAGRVLGNVPYLALPHPLIDFATFDEKLLWVAEHKTELGNHLQIYATDYVRAKDPFYWVRATAARISADRPQVALLSDVRFLQEFYYIKANGGYTVRVSRQGFVGLNDGRSDNHPSETQLDNTKFDFEINVLDGELEELKRDAVTVFNLIVDITKTTGLDEGVVNVEVPS